jgi:hypothetical protein
MLVGRAQSTRYPTMDAREFELMSLRSKLHNPAAPVIVYEIIPPTLEDPSELDDRLKLVGDVKDLVDVINIPEIRDEVARGARSRKLPERMEPRAFGKAIHDYCGVEAIINRVTVHDDAATQLRWLHDSVVQFGVKNLILVGGESNNFAYPGPSVAETARLARQEGLEFFTTQVLLEAADTIALLNSLRGANVRLILSFTPISHPRDLSFLEWLGVTIPTEVAGKFGTFQNAQAAAQASIELAKSILVEVCQHLAPDSPALGIQVERITKRNSAAAVQMLRELQDYYPKLLESRNDSLQESRGAPVPHNFKK